MTLNTVAININLRRARRRITTQTELLFLRTDAAIREARNAANAAVRRVRENNKVSSIGTDKA